ncbi:hypothetical protein [Sinomonas humi]|uniref:hypothetical protein n=1 Tax=Sinomonas humi TaxID=1338436 RepID=UPI00068B1B9E|nr:hypothetical protein [Sinomonas humi]
MREIDFFIESDTDDPFDRGQIHLDEDLIRRVHAGDSAGMTDIEVAVPLARLVHDEYLSRATDENMRINVAQSRAVMSALRNVLERLGVPFSPPFRDFDDFYRYWRREGATGSGSWAVRRQMLADLFDPVHDRLADLEAGAVASELAQPITSHTRTGWTLVDEEITELRRHFQTAQTPQDYRNIGNDCVIVLERLSAVAYVANRHLKPGETEPSIAQTKNRLERVAEVDLVGPSNAELRKLVKAAIEQAQAVKHRTPDRLQAGIAADSVILLANILRRIALSVGEGQQTSPTLKWDIS